MSTFPTLHDFKKQEPIKWREIPLGVYHIDEFRRADDSDRMIVELSNADNEKFVAQAPDRLTERLHNNPACNYVLHEGLQPCRGNPSKYYFAFRLMKF